MFLTMAIGLYTSRVILQVLGVSDFGIYNVVGGIVATISFINSALTAASQRFISFELGRGSNKKLSKIFSISVTAHFMLAIICCILAECVGVWFVNYRMNIDPARLIAANCVLQCTILTFLLNIISVPYNAVIVAHEKMSIFAYISLFEAIMKLLLVFMLLFINYDKLIVYALLQLLLALMVRGIYVFYCKYNFSECRYYFIFDKALFKRIFSFAGWSVVGNMGFTMKDPISNIILNLFFGTTVNAARGIAIQINGLVNSFVSNLGMALNPQIVKRYAAGDYKGSMELVYSGARLSFYLLTIISIPIIININYVLNLWLAIVPKYTSIFFIFTVLSSLIYSLSGTTSVAVQATGHIKWFSIGVCIIPLSELPIAYILLKSGYPPYSAMYPTLFTSLITLFFRFYVLKNNISIYSWRMFLIRVVLKSLLTFALAFLLSWLFHEMKQDSFSWFVLTSFISLIITITMIIVVGLNSKERILLRTSCLAKFKSIFKKR